MAAMVVSDALPLNGDQIGLLCESVRAHGLKKHQPSAWNAVGFPFGNRWRLDLTQTRNSICPAKAFDDFGGI